MSRRSGDRSSAAVQTIVRWYFERVYGRWEGPGTLPFYCDRRRVGHFAVRPEDLAAGTDAALFRLFVAMAMFQARRDVVIMSQQRKMPPTDALSLTSRTRLLRLVRSSPCEHLTSATEFDESCDVRKRAGVVTCDYRPELRCHVKEASTAMLRMGDMGKLPTSALLHFGTAGRLDRELSNAVAKNVAPSARAKLLVERLSRVYRVGRKLATMFVSALSVPALAPGLTPWFPAVDGAALVIIDTNVAQTVDTLRRETDPRTYEARAEWIRNEAAKIDLKAFHRELPSTSPRLVQQALYAFRSRSNRVANRDPCATSAACSQCAKSVCPFSIRSAG